MKEWWGKDFTGRFASRPFYTQDYIENKAFEVLHRCGTASGQTLTHPLEDESLELLVEFLTDNFDQAADTASYGVDIDGFTVFARHGKPSVVLNQDLLNSTYRLRRRFTIGHELGHVVLHQPLYERDDRQLDLLVQKELVPVYCAKQDIERSVDWCEWQAGHFGGALLMPKRLVHQRLADRDSNLVNPVRAGTLGAERVMSVAAEIFDVSRDAARVRLSSLGIITSANVQQLGDQTA
jgi:Zn-dependent peptidase ImmA (M78 family)